MLDESTLQLQTDIIYLCFLVTKSASKLGGNDKVWYLTEMRGYNKRIVGQPFNSFEGLISTKFQNFDAD